MKVIIGGTFSYLHKGHEALIRKAFKMGDSIYIGLTTDEYVSRNKQKVAPESYDEREKNLRRFIKQFKKRFEIIPLEDRHGPATTGNFDAIVVSKDTYPVAIEINELRKKRGLKGLKVIEIDYVFADDNKPITSTRIFNGEIDRDGKLI